MPINEEPVRKPLKLLVRHDLIELAKAKGENISRRVEEFLAYYLGVNSPTEDISAEIAKTEAKLAALKISLEQAEAIANIQRPELNYWRQIYNSLSKGMMTESQRKRWIDRVAKMLKIEPGELEKELEGV